MAFDYIRGTAAEYQQLARELRCLLDRAKRQGFVEVEIKAVPWLPPFRLKLFMPAETVNNPPGG